MTHLQCQNTIGQSRVGEVPGESAGQSPPILESLIASSPSAHRRKGDGGPGLASGAVIGTVVGWNDAGQPLVIADEIMDEPRAARTAVVASTLHQGLQVVLLFERSDPERPIVMAALSDSTSGKQPGYGDASVQFPLPPGVEAEATVDDDRIVLKADREIVLKCGKASLTLTRAGKIILRGAYVLSRSSGVNRIKGGSVQIN